MKQSISVQDAVENLSAIAQMDEAGAASIGIHEGRIFSSPEEFTPGTTLWLREEGLAPIQSVLNQSYIAIYKHLQELLEEEKIQLDNLAMQEGLSSMMAVAALAASKIGFSPEYQQLNSLYREKIEPYFETDRASENDLPIVFEGPQSVIEDTDYELFHIYSEEGSPYFTPELLRVLRIHTSSLQSFEEDPLLKVRAITDRDVHQSASYILRVCYVGIQAYFKEAHGLQGNDLAANLGKAFIALFLAANPRHLIQNTEGKSCLQYFEDFQLFLREALRSDEYQKQIAYPSETDKTSRMLLSLAHLLCEALFFRTSGVRGETIGLIHRTMRKGEDEKRSKGSKLFKSEGVWNKLLLDDEKLRSFLSLFPNGPIFKILDAIREDNDIQESVFDPIGQGNLPFRLFQVRIKDKITECLHLPCPTAQKRINKAEIIDEFRGFLRSLKETKKLHLIVNLQDRTSWKENTRSRCLETLSRNAEFGRQLYTITLLKAGDFYHQVGAYANLTAAQFVHTFLKQLESPEEYGFFFPPSILPAVQSFAKEALSSIHKHLFANNKELSRDERKIFIEIFYQMLIAKVLEIIRPDTMSFTCKDAIDTGAAQGASFYGFITLLNQDFTEKSEQDFLYWLLYAPALFIRERPINIERLTRTISLLEYIDQQKEVIEKGFGELCSAEVKHL